MGKLGTYKIRRVRAFLLNKLGIDFRQGKEPFGYYILDGRRQLKVGASNVHGSKELGKGATRRLMNELLTSNEEFDALYSVLGTALIMKRKYENTLTKAFCKNVSILITLTLN